MRTALLFLVVALTEPRVHIAVLPQAAMAGDTVRITCTVPKHPDNRKLVMGIPGYTQSEKDLEGEYAPITHRQYYQHVPCGVELAVCMVVDNLGKTYIASLPLQIAGCEP